MSSLIIYTLIISGWTSCLEVQFLADGPLISGLLQVIRYECTPSVLKYKILIASKFVPKYKIF